jgi:hypothetical protein
MGSDLYECVASRRKGRWILDRGSIARRLSFGRTVVLSSPAGLFNGHNVEKLALDRKVTTGFN